MKCSLADYWRNLHWFDAVRAADASDDLGPLVRLLRSGAAMERLAHLLLADLFDPRRLKRRRGRPLKKPLLASDGSAWIDALRQAERFGDLGPFVCLLRSDTLDQSTRDLLAKLLDQRQLGHKQRRPKSLFRVSAQDRLLSAVKAVRQVRQTNKVWKDARATDPEFIKHVEDELGDPEFFKRVRDPKARDEVGDPEEYIRRVKDLLEGDPRKFVRDISDPVGYVARQLGLNAKTLEAADKGKIGFGRKAKPKPSQQK